MKYAKFQQQVADFINKSNLAHIIPTLIRYGQELLEEELRLETMIVNQTNDVGIGDQSFLEPALFIEMKSVRLMSASATHEKYPPLVKKEWDYFSDNKLPLTDAGRPDKYAISNVVETVESSLPDTGITALTAESFVFNRPAGEAYLIEQTFYRKQAVMVEDEDANWWLTNAEEAFLYATLVKARGYLAKDDPRRDQWAGQYIIAKDSIIAKDNRARRGGQISRNKPWR